MWNSQSLNNKINDFIRILHDDSINICFLSETWLRSQNNNVTALLNESGYRISHFNRTKEKGGGVAILSKQVYQSKFEKLCKYMSFECVIQTLKTNNSAVNLTLIVIYRHGSENVNVFLDEFHDFLEYVKLNFLCFVICGDFNIHVNKVTDCVTVKFMDILNIFSLHQCVKVSTHKYGNILDLVIHDPNSITISDIIIDSIDRPGSDHYLVYFKLMCNIASVEKLEVSFRDFKKVILPDFHADILMDTNRYLIESDDNDFKSSIDLFFDIYGDTVNRHAPVVNKVVNAVTRPPWMDTEFVAARRERRRLYKKWKRDKTVENRDNFTQSRAAVNVLAHDKRCNYYQGTINSCTNSQRELFKICNNLLDNSKKSKLPYSENFNVLADRFNNYFVEKIENIRNNLDLNSSVVFEETQDISNSNISTLSTFKSVTSEDILKQVKSAKIKTSQNDPIPAFLLKSSIELIIPSLLHLVNSSLRNGSMEGLKESIVTPILKKAGLDKDTLSNYRPVCGGLYVDKLIQKNVCIQLNDHMDLNHLHIPYQSGYKSYHSCETVLLRILNDILLTMDSKSCSILLLLDLSAAFDTVDHEKLLLILSNEIGLKGTVLNWFRSFLSGRLQATSVKGCTSSYIHMKYGVPQGSVLGPVLFNIYIRNFINLLRSAGYVVHGYADDHQVITAFRIEFQYQALCYSLPNCLNLIANWMSSYFLKLNAGKSNLLIFSPKNLREDVLIDRVYLGNNTFLPVSFEAMNLGVKLDHELTFSPHISMIMNQSYTMISDIGRIKKYLTVNDLRCLVQCIIVSRLDNCNSLFYGIQEYEIARLQKLQNSCARLIYGRKKFDHVSDLYIELHWLPIKQRIIFKILLLVYKIFLNMAPVYIEECVTITNTDNRILLVPKVNTAYGERAFTNYAPKLWNALPEFIRNSDTIGFFKGHLKHHLFSNFSEFIRVVNRYRE